MVMAKGVSADHGVRWYKCSWNLFRRDFGTWLIMILIFLLISIGINVIPLIGPLAMTILSPVLLGGFMYTVSEADKGNPVEIGNLFQGFRDKARMNPLLILGAFTLAAQVVLVLAVFGLLGGSALANVGESGSTDPQAMMSAGLMTSVLLISLIIMVISAGFFYAAPLVMLDEMTPLEAIKVSFSACLKNVLPLSVFGLVALALSVVAIIPFGLGFIILVPVSFLAVYYSYKSIFH